MLQLTTEEVLIKHVLCIEKSTVGNLNIDKTICSEGGSSLIVTRWVHKVLEHKKRKYVKKTQKHWIWKQTQLGLEFQSKDLLAMATYKLPEIT